MNRRQASGLTFLVTIVVLSRLAYRKGIDLLVAAAPRICARFPHVHFVIGLCFGGSILGRLLMSRIGGGDGPKLIDLLQMREKFLLQDRIELLGPIHPRDVRSVGLSVPFIFNHKPISSYFQVLARGAIFMNTSLTEAFGIAILEAACAGLYVVSTRVGGIPEILPEDMISFANPDEDGDPLNPIHPASVSDYPQMLFEPFQMRYGSFPKTSMILQRRTSASASSIAGKLLQSARK